MSSPVEEIKARLDIVELIGSYVRLQKAGANFRATCPFHNERTPSFVVSPARQIWHCFGCGKGGDMFRFIMEMDGSEFSEALRTLADRAGVVLRKENPEIRNKRMRMHALLEEATIFFESSLANRDIIKQYLRDRGLRDETIREFRLGYAPDEWEALYGYLSEKKFRSDEIERAGLAVKSQKNYRASGVQYYDRFRGRIIFPICDYQGRVIAFGGRIHPEKLNEAKYINSPETELYQKGKVFYGMHKAKTEIFKEESVILVEGYMDMLMAYQAGTKNVVATSGTALSSDQLSLLKRMSRRLIIGFDMDEAGSVASKRGIDLALVAGFSVQVIRLSDGVKDPADSIQKDPAGWHDAVANARHLIQFYIDYVSLRADPATAEGKREFERSVMPWVSRLSSELEMAHWSQEISRILGVKEEAIWGILRKDTHKKNGRGEILAPPRDITANAAKRTRKELLEERILGMIAHTPAILQELSNTVDESYFSENRALVFRNLSEQTDTANSPFKDFISKLIIEAELFLEGIEDAKAEFLRCRQELEREYVKERMQVIAGHLQKVLPGSPETVHLVAEFQSLSMRLAQLTNERAR